jgi:hypothetical protein
VGKTIKEEIEGQVVSHIPENEFDMVSAASDAVRTETHITLTRAGKSGVPQVEVEREVLERIISLCPHEHEMKNQLHGQQCYYQAHLASLGQLPLEEQSKWGNIIAFTREGRNIRISGWGPNSEMESVQELTLRHAQENLDMVGRALAVSALGGEPALLAPR